MKEHYPGFSSLSPQERHKERVRINNEKRKAERRKFREDNNLPPIGVTPADKREMMRNYMRERRKKWLEENGEQHAAELAERKAKRAEQTAARRKELLLKRNEQQKERRKLAKLNGAPDTRTKQGRVKPHYKQLLAVKSKSVCKASKPKRARKAPELKPELVQIPTREIDTTKLIPVQVNAKTTVYVKQGTDVQATIAKFNSRRL